MLLLVLLLAAPPVDLEGKVIGPGGVPVAGARIWIRARASGPPTLALRADAERRFKVTLPRAPEYAMRVVPPAPLAPRTLWHGRPGGPVTITLETGLTLEGVVRDGASGKPVPLARVDAEKPGSSWLTEPWTGQERFARTDARGHFRLAGLPRGTLTVTARAPGFGQARQEVTAPRALELYLFPGSRIEGQVRGPDGKGVVGAAVRVESEVVRSGAEPLQFTGANGAYEVAALDPGTYRVLAQSEGWAPAWASGVEVDERGAHTDLRLDRGARVRGRLVAHPEEGPDLPVVGQVAIATWDDRPLPASLKPVLSVEAGEDGRFELPHVPPGAFALDVASARHGHARVAVDVRAADAAIDVGDVRLVPGRVLRGRVRDDEGRDLSGVEVSASAPGGVSVTGTSDDGGRFLLAGLSAGTRFFAATLPGYAPTLRELYPGKDEVDVVLHVGARVHGRVVDEQGQPVATFSARLDPGPNHRGPTMPETAEGVEGTFSVDGVAGGRWVVRIDAPDHPQWSGSPVEIEAGATVDLGTIRLAAGGVLRGEVVDGSGVGVPGVQVLLEEARGSMHEAPATATAATGSDGRFEARGVPPGLLTLLATHPRYTSVRSAVEPGATEIRIVLGAGGRVEGVVHGRPEVLATSLVEATPPSEDRPDWGRRRMGTVREDGTFTLDHVPPGPIDVVLLVREGGIRLSRAHQRVEIAEGEVRRVELTLRDILVTGRVSRAGIPVGGARLTFMAPSGRRAVYGLEPPSPPEGPERDTATTRADGTYESILSEPGAFLVRIEAAERSVARNATIPDVDAARVDFELPAAVVAGRVVRADGTGIGGAWVTVKPPRERATQGRSGADGAFEVDASAGPAVVRASADGFAPASLSLDVPPDGARGITLFLRLGLSISGRVVDRAGRGVEGVIVTATEDGDAAGMGASTSDGSFQIEDLEAGTYVVQAGDDRVGYAARGGVEPGSPGLVLALTPGGRLRVRVTDAGGAPQPGIFVGVDGIDDLPISGQGLRTDAEGRAAFSCPVGRLHLIARDLVAGRTRAEAAVEVRPGEEKEVELRSR